MGKKLKAADVFSMSIHFLITDMLSVLNTKIIGESITMDDVHWVLTVPAIWSDAAKQFMREAATQPPASIPTEKLSIALEPEAASIFCRNLSVEKMKGSESISKLPTGTKYMILDAGGGTIDITIHEVTSTGGLKEVHAASGGGWGGILVDEAFQDLLCDILGKERYLRYMEQETEDWIDLWRSFEMKKKMVNPTKAEETRMKINLSLIQFESSESHQDLQNRIAESIYAKQIKLTKDKLRIDSQLMQALFEKSISTTVEHIKSVLRHEQARDTKAILMVGGFSDSLMLQEAIKREFENLRVMIPNEASSAIMRGAVIFGHDPAAISERVLKKTYGVRICACFKEGVHDEKLKVTTDKGIRCKNIFDKHVEKDTSVKVGEAQTEKEYIPVYHNQDILNFAVFASDLRDPMYTTDGCLRLGKLEVDISDVPGDLDRVVYVNLTFSGTEVNAEGRIKGTDKNVSAKFDFLG